MTDKDWLYAQNWVEQTQYLLYRHYRGGIHWAIGVGVGAKTVVGALRSFEPEMFASRVEALLSVPYLPPTLLR